MDLGECINISDLTVFLLLWLRSSSEKNEWGQRPVVSRHWWVGRKGWIVLGLSSDQMVGMTLRKLLLICLAFGWSGLGLLLLLLPKQLLSYSSFVPNLGLLLCTWLDASHKKMFIDSYHNKQPPYYCCNEFFILDWSFPFALRFWGAAVCWFSYCKHKVRLQFVSCPSQSLQSHRNQACPFKQLQ